MTVVTAPATAAAPAPAAPAVVFPAGDAPSSAEAGDSTGERTLTRREMRAMLQAQAANQQANHSPAITDPVFPVTFTQDADAVPSDPQAAPLAAPVSARQAEQAPDTDVSSSPTSVFTAFGAPTTATPVAAASAQSGQLDADDEDLAGQERRPFTPPTGHWSTAAELEDGSEPITSRNVGHSTAATTTNALILPSLPQADATGPLTSTGESTSRAPSAPRAPTIASTRPTSTVCSTARRTSSTRLRSLRFARRAPSALTRRRAE